MWITNEVFFTRCRAYYSALHGEKSEQEGTHKWNFCHIIGGLLGVWGQLLSFQNWSFLFGKDQSLDLES